MASKFSRALLNVMDQASVSFTTIQSPPDFDQSLVDVDSIAIIEKLWGEMS